MFGIDSKQPTEEILQQIEELPPNHNENVYTDDTDVEDSSESASETENVISSTLKRSQAVESDHIKSPNKCKKEETIPQETLVEAADNSANTETGVQYIQEDAEVPSVSQIPDISCVQELPTAEDLSAAILDKIRERVSDDQVHEEFDDDGEIESPRIYLLSDGGSSEGSVNKGMAPRREEEWYKGLAVGFVTGGFVGATGIAIAAMQRGGLMAAAFPLVMTVCLAGGLVITKIR